MIALMGGTEIVATYLLTIELLIAHMMKNLICLAGSPSACNSLGCTVEDGTSLNSNCISLLYFVLY